MKASELIEKLQKLIAENGDVEIHISDHTSDDCLITDADRIEFEEDMTAIGTVYKDDEFVKNSVSGWILK